MSRNIEDEDNIAELTGGEWVRIRQPEEWVSGVAELRSFISVLTWSASQRSSMLRLHACPRSGCLFRPPHFRVYQIWWLSLAASTREDRQNGSFCGIRRFASLKTEELHGLCTGQATLRQTDTNLQEMRGQEHRLCLCKVRWFYYKPGQADHSCGDAGIHGHEHG